MGEPKGGLILAGRPLVVHAYGILSPLERSLGEVVVVGRPGTPSPGMGVAVIHDLHPGRGPVAGLHAALLHAVGRGLQGAFVLACDLPLVPTEWVARILEAAGGRPALPVSAGPLGYEPLCAFYPASALGVVEAFLHDGKAGAETSMAELVRRLEPIVRVDPGGVPAEAGAGPHPGPFLNVNRPDDLDRAARYLRRASPTPRALDGDGPA
jgi:molybdenum cofactor guanylyltransferase